LRRRYKPPKEIPLRKLKKLLKPFGISHTTNDRHYRGFDGLRKQDSKSKYYSVPVDQPGDMVRKIYVDAIRKEYGLTDEFGITDDVFYSGL
jgi:hypothetical protein